NQFDLYADGKRQRIDGGVSTRERAGNDYDVHRRRRSPDRHPLLLGEESTTDDNARHLRCAEAIGIFPCSHHRIEITRRLAQYGPYRDPGRQRSFDSRVDLPVQGEEREKNLPIYASMGMNKLTTRCERDRERL